MDPQPAATPSRPAPPPWPEGVPDPPAPGRDLAPWQRWLADAVVAVERRLAAHAGELERLASQWAHVLTNIARLRPEEVDAVLDGQARLREEIAADAALHRVLEHTRAQVAAWSEALSSPLTDPTLVGRLLDDAVEDRGRLAGVVVNDAVDVLSSLAMDLEVVGRQLARDPGQSAPVLLATLRERVAAAAERLRDQPLGEAVLQQHGEPLAATLQRIADRHAGRLETTVTWSGPDVRDPDDARAIASVALECVAHLAERAGRACEVAVEHSAQGVTALRIRTRDGALLPDGDPGWLLRARARVALAQGRLVAGRDGDASFVEARFGG